MQAPKVLEEQTRPNLSKLLIEDLLSGSVQDEITVTESNLPISIKVKLSVRNSADT
jgi:hypothetical protein